LTPWRPTFLKYLNIFSYFMQFSSLLTVLGPLKLRC
jgi:hypothetical protein